MFDISAFTIMNKPRKANSFSFSALIAGAILASYSPTLAGPVKLAPHRAVYDMTFERTTSTSNITDLKGRLVYEITGDACQGYTQSMRFVTHSTYQSGQPSRMDMRSKFWEDGRSQNFKFDTDHYQNEKLAQKAVGIAKRRGEKNSVRVKLSHPHSKTFDLSKNILFPIQHTLKLLEAAHKGETVFVADLYDGSEKGTQVYATTAVMGSKKTGIFNTKLKRIKNAEVLDGLAAWPISQSYFEQQEKQADALPNYELGFLFYENGVSRKLVINYGHFAIRGHLTALEMFSPSECKQ